MCDWLVVKQYYVRFDLKGCALFLHLAMKTLELFKRLDQIAKILQACHS